MAYYQFSQEQIEAIDKASRDDQAAEVKKKASVENTKLREDIQYTMFISGLRNGRQSELEGKNQTDDLAIIFDAVLRHTYTKDYNKTSYAVESKSRISDHVTTQDGKISFSAKVTDSPIFMDTRGYIDRDTDHDNPRLSKRPSKAIEILETIADGHQLVTLVTEDNILTNYVITNFTIDRQTESGAGIDISMTLEEFRITTVGKTVLARTTDPKKVTGGGKNSGTKQTADDGPVADSASGKRETPYISKKAATAERWENATVGTTDFSGEAGAKLPFNPGSLLRP